MHEDIIKFRKEKYRIETQTQEIGILENVDMYKCDIMEMANYHVPELVYGIWFDESGKSRINKHQLPRVKIIMPNGNLIPVSVEENPEILLKGSQLAKAKKELKGVKRDEMFRFISNNRGLILQHWNGEITTVILFQQLEVFEKFEEFDILNSPINS